VDVVKRHDVFVKHQPVELIPRHDAWRVGETRRSATDRNTASGMLAIPPLPVTHVDRARASRY